MPDISLPEIHLPDVKLPDGLRDMTRKDVQKAIGDITPPQLPRRIEMPDIDLSKIEMPKALEGRLPKAVEDRLPMKRRSNPILPVAALVAIGSMIAAAWWLITTPDAGTRVRHSADRLRLKLSGQPSGVVIYDDDGNLSSLLPDQPASRPTIESERWPDTDPLTGETIRAGNGSVGEQPAPV
jgi:hypothetical protein